MSEVRQPLKCSEANDRQYSFGVCGPTTPVVVKRIPGHDSPNTGSVNSWATLFFANSVPFILVRVRKLGVIVMHCGERHPRSSIYPRSRAMSTSLNTIVFKILRPLEALRSLMSFPDSCWVSNLHLPAIAQ